MTAVEPHTTDVEQPTASAELTEHPSEARESQDSLTRSVGQRLTRESRDAQQPWWKRWLGKG